MRWLDTVRRLGDVAARWLRRRLARRALPRTGPYWVALELPSPLPDAPGRFAGERARTLFGVLETLAAIAEDPRAQGVLLEDKFCLLSAPRVMTCFATATDEAGKVYLFKEVFDQKK